MPPAAPATDRTPWGVAGLLVLLGLLSLLGGGPDAAGLDVERARRYLGWAGLQQAWLVLFLLPVAIFTFLLFEDVFEDISWNIRL